MDALYRHVITPLEYYRDRCPSEWLARIVAQEKLLFGGKKEECNVITEVAKVLATKNEGQGLTAISAIQVKFDINTHQGKKESRFALPELPEFVEAAQGETLQIGAQVEGMLDG